MNMLDKKVVFLICLVLLSLIPLVSGQTRFFDYGYSGGGTGLGTGSGFGFISGLCDNYGEWFEFFIFFIIFFVVGHWAFEKRGKSDILAGVIAFALAIGLVRWQGFSGFSLVCGLGDTLGGLFGGFFGIIILVGIILLFFWMLKSGSNVAKVAVSLGYVLFYFWMVSEGGYRFSSLFYYLPFNPLFVEQILNIILAVAVVSIVYFGLKWHKEGA